MKTLSIFLSCRVFACRFLIRDPSIIRMKEQCRHLLFPPFWFWTWFYKYSKIQVFVLLKKNCFMKVSSQCNLIFINVGSYVFYNSCCRLIRSLLEATNTGRWLYRCLASGKRLRRMIFTQIF